MFDRRHFPNQKQLLEMTKNWVVNTSSGCKRCCTAIYHVYCLSVWLTVARITGWSVHLLELSITRPDNYLQQLNGQQNALFVIYKSTFNWQVFDSLARMPSVKVACFGFAFCLTAGRDCFWRTGLQGWSQVLGKLRKRVSPENQLFRETSPDSRTFQSWFQKGKKSGTKSNKKHRVKTLYCLFSFGKQFYLEKQKSQAQRKPQYNWQSQDGSIPDDSFRINPSLSASSIFTFIQKNLSMG